MSPALIPLSPDPDADSTPAVILRPTAWMLERFDAGLGLAAQLVAVGLIVLIGTLIAALLYQVFDLTRLAIFFLGSVIVCALAFGTRAAVFGAFLAFIAYNFSLVEPRFSFQFAGADDALTLTAFLIVALLVGGLAGKVRESERDSRRRADLLETLLDASRAFSTAADSDALTAALADQLEKATNGDAFVLPGADVDVGTLDADAAARLIHAARQMKTLASEGPWRAKALPGTDDLGVAVWRIGETPASEIEPQNRLGALLVDLGASALARIRLVDLKTEAEASLQAGRLRDAILGSISHDLRTPLATVLASASSLRDYDERFDAGTRRELADGIVQEAERLNSYVKSLLDLSRIEAGHLVPTFAPVLLVEVIDAVLRRLDPGDAHDVHIESMNPALEVEADANLLEQVVFNLLDNALLHGGPDVRIDVRAISSGGWVDLEIEDNGVGVADGEYEQLCEKFYRGMHRQPDARGSGIGLSIAKGFVEAMGGSIHLGRSGSGGPGLRVSVTLALSGTRDGG